MRARLMPPRVPAMRYHNRLSMKRRPQPSCGNLGCETSIEDPIRERSNITISIVKLLASIPPDHRWERKAKGWFLEFRLIPVLLWSYTAVVLGTAVASLRRRVVRRFSRGPPLRARRVRDPDALDFARRHDGPRRSRPRLHCDARRAPLSR